MTIRPIDQHAVRIPQMSGLLPRLYIPIAARDTNAIEIYVGSILKELARCSQSEEALNCFAFGLSADCRLKEYRCGKFAYKWTIESKENGEWVEDSTTGFFLFPFWMRKEVRYLQNNLIVGENVADKRDI